MFKFKKKKKISPELKNIFDKILSIINNENLQNSRAPQQIRDLVINGVDCDEIPFRKGIFGFEITNPIPVNSIIGEQIYLSNLINDNGQRIMFHRLGSTEQIDIFETVTLDGKIWEILFLDMYHPRKSRNAPDGYKILKENFLFSGISDYCDDFPNKLYDLIFEKTKMLFGVPMPLKEINTSLENNLYGRPSSHIKKIKNLNIESLNLQFTE